MNETEMTLIQQKIKFYFDRKHKVHIDTKADKFYNGFIKEIHTEFILFDDRFLGSLPIFFLEIKEIEDFK